MADIKKCELTVSMDQQVYRADAGVIETSVWEDEGWKRGLSSRAVVMLSLGGGIGLGLWIGTGTALEAGECNGDGHHTLQSSLKIADTRTKLVLLVALSHTAWLCEYALTIGWLGAA
jgi:hypothetical protein